MTSTPAIWNTPTSYTAAFGAEINGLPVSNTAISSLVVSNTSNLSTDGWISWSVSGTAVSGVSYLGFYLLPLNADGITYGDNTASGTPTPDSQYAVGTAAVQPPVSGNIVGSLYIGAIPPTAFKLSVYNGTSGPFAPSGNAIYFASNAINLAG